MPFGAVNPKESHMPSNHDHHAASDHSHHDSHNAAVERHVHETHGHDLGGTKHQSQHGSHEGHSVEGFRKRFWVSLVMTVPVLMLSPMLQHWAGMGDTLRFSGDAYLLLSFSSLLFFYGGYPFLRGFVGEIISRKPGMMTLIAVAISTAYVYSCVVVLGLQGEVFFWETATLIDIMLLGHWIEMKSVLGASRALEELAKLMPSDAHKIMPDGHVKDTPLSDLVAGDRVLVKPGEKIPADGDVIDGASSVNESMLTGESNPVDKEPGTKVIGGAINGEGSLTVEVKRTGKESFLSQVIELVKVAQQSKSRHKILRTGPRCGLRSSHLQEARSHWPCGSPS